MHAGNIVKAEKITEIVRLEILRNNSAELSGASISNTRDLWKAVRKFSGRGREEGKINISHDILNQHYAVVSTDSCYEAPSLN